MTKGLGKELFKLVEARQGHAFISDSVEDMPAHMVLEIARQSLKLNRELVGILQAFVDRYDSTWKQMP